MTTMAILKDKHPHHCYLLRKLLFLLSSYNYGGSHRGKIPRSTSSTTTTTAKLYIRFHPISIFILLLLSLSTLTDGHQSIETLSSSSSTTEATSSLPTTTLMMNISNDDTIITTTELLLDDDNNNNNNVDVDDDDENQIIPKTEAIITTTFKNIIPNLSTVDDNNHNHNNHDLLPLATMTSTAASTTTTTLKSNQIFNQSSIIVNDNNVNIDCFQFDQIVEKYPLNQICHENIEIDGRYFNKHLSFIKENNGLPNNLTKLISQYEHCHIISGFVSLRHFYFNQNDSLLINLVFPNLEFIRDFLLIHNFRSINDDLNVNITLGHIFPRLKRIYGYRRIDNIALTISNFWTSDHISIDSLQQVCGTVKILESRPYFRHSSTYWHLVDRYRNRKLFTKMARFQSNYLIPIRTINDDENGSNIIGFDSRLRFDNIISTIKRRIYPILHASIYEIDPTFYSFVETGDRRSTFFCNISSRIVILSDLDYSDKQFLFPYHTNSFDQKNFPYWKTNNLYESFKNESHIHPAHFLYNRRLDNIDICRLHNIYYDDNYNNDKHQSMMITNETYPFQFEHFYVIKLEFCVDRRHEKCIVHQHYIFNPKYDDFEQILFKIQQQMNGNWILKTIIIIISILTLSIIGLFICCQRQIRLYRLFGLKSFVNMDVISVNPDYGNMSNNNHHTDHSNHFWSTTFHYGPQQPLSSSSSSSIITNDNITCEINRQSLKLNPQKTLGKGEFGIVYEGLLLLDHDLGCSYHRLAGTKTLEETTENSISSCTCMTQSNPNNDNIPSIRVAIKQLKDNGFTGSGAIINKEKFIQEAKFMKTFNSNFLVKLLGVSTAVEPILVVMEYMEHNDLKRFLRQRYQDYLKSRNNDLLPSFDQLARMAIQIADGMHYLHSKRVIHRDLAARNCMVAADLTVKIGDFGLTRDLYEKDYYRLSEETPMPLRWMAPESVRNQVYTPYSDVWSYGVVLWEIMSFGEQPYHGRSDMEVKKLLANNGRLSRPLYYFEPLWEIAKLCWCKRPTQRPCFGEIIEMLYPHLSTNRDQFDNLSYYVSSRMGSYVKYSTFGLMINHCFSFVWNLCSSNKSPSSKNRQSSMFTSTSAASTSISQPLLNQNQNQQQQQRRDTNSSQQSTSTIIDCGCSKLPLRFQKKKPLLLSSSPFKRLHRQFSTCSSSTNATTATTTTTTNNVDQMIMMNMVYPSPTSTSSQLQLPPPSSLITCSSQTLQSHPPLSNLWNNHPIPNLPSSVTIPYGSWIQMNSNNHSNFFPLMAQQHYNHHHHHPQQQQYSSMESLPSSSITDTQTDITTLTSSAHHHYPHPYNQLLFHNHQYPQQQQLLVDDNCNYEIMSAGGAISCTMNGEAAATADDNDDDDDDDVISKENPEISSTMPLI